MIPHFFPGHPSDQVQLLDHCVFDAVKNIADRSKKIQKKDPEMTPCSQDIDRLIAAIETTSTRRNIRQSLIRAGV